MSLPTQLLPVGPGTSLFLFSTTSLFQVKLLSYLEMLKSVRHMYGILAIAAAGCTALVPPLRLGGEVSAWSVVGLAGSGLADERDISTCWCQGL